MILAAAGEKHPKGDLAFGRTKVRAIIKIVEADGWRRVRQSGSHRHFRHHEKRGTVTIAGHPRDEIHPKTKASIMTQAGLGR